MIKSTPLYTLGKALLLFPWREKATRLFATVMTEIVPFGEFVRSWVLDRLGIPNESQPRTTREIGYTEKKASELTKEEINSMRSKHFCKKVTISYSNSGGLMIVGGSGSRLYDESGKSYLDTRNNVCHVGHQHPKVIEAVQRQVAALNSNTRYLHPNVALLAERIADLLPDPLEVVFFVNSGSEANDLALRLARAYSGTKNTIVVDRAYHGHTLAVTEISPYKFEKTREIKLVRNGPHMTPGPHIWKVPCPDTYRGKHRDPETAGALYADYVEEACHTYYRQRGEKVSAFIIESGMSVAGVVMPPKNYLIDAVNSVREAGGLFIADEVQTGFGRFGECYWGFQYQNNDNGVVPDIVTMAKPFGNGMPLAAVVTSRKVAQVFESVAPEYFNTFGGNPVCAAAGLAVLDVIESEQLQAKAAEIGGYLKTRFRELKERLDIIGDIRGSGFFVGIEFVRDRKSLEPATEETSFICTKLKEKHSILTSIDGPHDNVLVIKPPMVFSKADVDELVGCFEKVVVEDLAQVENIMSISKTPT